MSSTLVRHSFGVFASMGPSKMPDTYPPKPKQGAASGAQQRHEELLSWRLLLDLAECQPREFRTLATCRTTQVISMRCRSNLVPQVGILACVGVEDEFAPLKPPSQATCIGQSRLFQLTPAIGRMGASILRVEMQPLSSIIRMFEVDGEMTKKLVHLPVDRAWHPLTVRFRLLIRKT